MKPIPTSLCAGLRFFAVLTLAPAAVLALETGKSATDAVLPATPDHQSELVIVVVEPGADPGNAFTNVDRMAIAFRDLAQKRHWPLRVTVTRLAANQGPADPELRISNERLSGDRPGELTYRGWMSLTAGGKRHDFGLVTVRYSTRPGEQTLDSLRQVFVAVAVAAAERIEPILFPPPVVTK